MVVSMYRWRGKVAVVTGASAGIGAAICEALLREGVNVVGLARNKEKLDQLRTLWIHHPGKFHPHQTDITKEEDIKNAFQWVTENVGPVYILVNNAGVVRHGTLIDGPTDHWRTVFETNVLGVCVATKEAVTIMRENDIDGHIVHVSSLAGHKVTPVPGLNVYSATKYAITALTETLRLELNSIGSKIKISDVSPGPVDTEIIETGMAGASATALESIKQFGHLFGNVQKLTPEDVADSVIYILSTPPNVQNKKLAGSCTLHFNLNRDGFLKSGQLLFVTFSSAL